jgi:PTH1 family peptidyl-tRNA hydrolase
MADSRPVRPLGHRLDLAPGSALGLEASAQGAVFAAQVAVATGKGLDAVEGLVASASPYLFWIGIELMTEQERWLIVGLGNPGRRYAHNRHNVGFHCLDRLASAHRLTFDQRQKRARLALGQIHGRPVVLLKPQTFMNESGRAVAPVARFYKVPLERLLVIFDDLDLPQGTVRIRPKGGSGGHKGMRSIIAQLGRTTQSAQDFPRVRVGIGRPPGRTDPAAYVLQNFSADEQPLMTEIYDWVVRTVECWLTEGIDVAMTRFNRSEE